MDWWDSINAIRESALHSFPDKFTQQRIQGFTGKEFSLFLQDLISEADSVSIRSRLRDNGTSFEGILKVSYHISSLLGRECLLRPFLCMTIHRVVRQTQSGGQSADCFNTIIGKLRRCSELATVFHSRCSNSQVPTDHAKERLSQAYRLHLDFLGAIIGSLDKGPLLSLGDNRWQDIHDREEECIKYMEESVSFLPTLIQDTKGASAQGPSVYILPKCPPRFCCRDRELGSIRNSLERNNSLTIQGIAGVGKSSVALQFAKNSMSEYSVILWMRCEPTTALDQGCVDSLRQLGLAGDTDKPSAEKRQIWRDYLSKADFRWLVIFDNVEHSEDLDQFWPAGENGKIIVTTRYPEIGFGLTEDELAIEPFNEADGQKCFQLLASWGKGIRVDEESAKAWNEELGGLPIGIVQMVALMRRRRTAADQFLTEYRQDRAKYHGRTAPGSVGIYPDSKPAVATNWNFDALSDDSKSLLGVLSFLSPDAIPQDLFKHWDEYASRHTRGLFTYCESRDRFLDVEEELMELALLGKDPYNEMMSVHRLQQLQFEQYLDKASRQRAFDQASKLLYDVFPNQHIGQRFTGRWNDCSLYIQHAVKINSRFLESDSASLPPPEFAKLMAWCSWYLFEIADFGNFRKVLDGGMRACEVLPKESVDEATWALLNYNAGTVQTSMGLFEEARLSLTEALRARRSIGNQDDIAATLNNLGLLYNSAHEFELAEKHYSEAFAIHLGRAETEDRNLSLTMVKHNLQRNGIQGNRNIPTIADLQATVDFFKRSISWWMEGHASLALGNRMLQLGRYDDAANAYRHGRDTLSAPGRASKQPAVAMIIYKLGCVAFEQGSLSEAAKYFRQSLEISRLYPALPMEQARTCFMLSEALRKGAEPAEPEEASKTDQDVTSLTEAFFKSSRKSEGKPPFLRGSDFNIYITAKYQ